MLPYFSSKGATCKYVECGFYDIEIYGYTVSINQYINHGSNKTYWRLRLGIYSCHWHFVFERFVRTFNLFSQCACMFGYWFLMDLWRRTRLERIILLFAKWCFWVFSGLFSSLWFMVLCVLVFILFLCSGYLCLFRRLLCIIFLLFLFLLSA